jgi:hypothetical protein
LLNWSSAVTVRVMVLPAVMLVGVALTAKCVAAVGLTTIAPLWPVIVLVTVSVAVSVWLPTVDNVALNVPTPAVKALLAGNVGARTLLWSLVVNVTVPAYPVAVLLNWSRAVTVKANLAPAVAAAGALMIKCVPTAALTVIGPLWPVMDVVTESVAVKVWVPAVLRIAAKKPMPLLRVEFAGRPARESLLVKFTVPVYPIAVLLSVSRAVTLKDMAAPAVVLLGALTIKCVAAVLTVRLA